MKITKRPTDKFGDLDLGEAFMYNGYLYVRIVVQYNRNALNLENYLLNYFGDDIPVIRSNAELVIA